MKGRSFAACGLVSVVVAGGCTFDSSQLRALGPDGGLGGGTAGAGGHGGTGSQTATATSTAPATCVPGASVACACFNGEQGAQTCTSAGTFAPCM
ncbi:MAG: hypothetical protein WBV96_11955, partial [Polyangia bacterium]